MLGESKGFTVYLFMPDAQGDSTCYDDCAVNWPFVAEVTAVGDGLDASLLGTTERTTGRGPGDLQRVAAVHVRRRRGAG